MIIPALLDSGSEISVITLALAKKLDLDFKMDSQWEVICGIGGRTIASYMKLDTIFSFVSENNDTSNQNLKVRLSVIDKGTTESIIMPWA